MDNTCGCHITCITKVHQTIVTKAVLYSSWKQLSMPHIHNKSNYQCHTYIYNKQKFTSPHKPCDQMNSARCMILRHQAGHVSQDTRPHLKIPATHYKKRATCHTKRPHSQDTAHTAQDAGPYITRHGPHITDMGPHITRQGPYPHKALVTHLTRHGPRSARRGPYLTRHGPTRHN